MRLKVSRQERPAATRIVVQALATTAQLPRLPEASMVTLTPMTAAYAPCLWKRELLSGQPILSGVRLPVFIESILSSFLSSYRRWGKQIGRHATTLARSDSRKGTVPESES